MNAFLKNFLDYDKLLTLEANCEIKNEKIFD